MPVSVFHLYHNDMNEISYNKGGFFKRHQDYLSLTSNIITEYTLILSLNEEDATVDCGETFVYNGEDTLKSAGTTVRGGALLFCKDLEHEGAVIKAGDKRIRSLNLWALDAPDASASQSILYVMCPDPAPPAEKPAAAAKTHRGKKDKTAELRDLATDSRSFALSASKVLSQFPDTMLAGLIRFKSATGDDDDGGGGELNIVRHESEFPSSQFATVVKVLVGEKISDEEVAGSTACLRYYGIPF